MPKLLDVVTLKVGRPGAGLAVGARGTIVDDFGDAYDIEFLDADGYTIAVETVPARDVILYWQAPEPRQQSAR